jgi:tetratricopeptide (TPR) repeat protein
MADARPPIRAALPCRIAGGRLAFLDLPTPSPALSDDDLFDQAGATEETHPVASVELYRQALAVNPKHIGAYTNLGRLLHARKQYDAAEAVYRQGLAHCGRDATPLFNLAIVFEDARRPADAAPCTARR